VVPGPVGCADHPGLRPKLGEHNRRMGPVLPTGQPVLERGPGLTYEQVTGLRYASAQHEAAGIENRGHIREPLPQPPADDVEAPQRGGVTLPRGSHDLEPGDALRGTAGELKQPDRRSRGTPGKVARLGDQRAAARVLLPAAAVAAAA